MARAPFSIFRRSTTDKNTGKKKIVFCCRFYDEQGIVTKTRALKATSAARAALEAKGLLDAGAPMQKRPTLRLALEPLAEKGSAAKDTELAIDRLWLRRGLL